MKKTSVDVCIISYAKTPELRIITERGIISLVESEDNDKNIQFNIFVVESNTDISYNEYVNTTTIYPDTPFGYNKYLNLAIKQGSSPYVFMANNDLTYERGWASEIIRQMNLFPDIMSASPFCPQVQSRTSISPEIFDGYQVRKHINGWAIFVKRELFDLIGPLNEEVDFWFSDDIYAEQLKSMHIRHCLVTNSIVNHHDKRLGMTAGNILSEGKINEFTTGQYEKYLKAKNKIYGSNH